MNMKPRQPQTHPGKGLDPLFRVPVGTASNGEIGRVLVLPCRWPASLSLQQPQPFQQLRCQFGRKLGKQLAVLQVSGPGSEQQQAWGLVGEEAQLIGALPICICSSKRARETLGSLFLLLLSFQQHPPTHTHLPQGLEGEGDRVKQPLIISWASLYKGHIAGLFIYSFLQFGTGD